MYILAIETTGINASVSIINENGSIWSRESKDRLNHLQNLIKMSQELLDEQKLSIDEIGLIAVSSGPGSFTGIRIGVSTARALGQALGIDIIAVPTLEAFLYNVEGYEGIVCPIFDARRNQVYAGAYTFEKEIIKGSAFNLDDFLSILLEKCENDEIMFFGDGIEAYEDKINNWISLSKEKGIRANIAQDSHRNQSSISVAKMGLKLFKDGKEPLKYMNVQPMYLRKSEAERKLEEGKLNV